MNLSVLRGGFSTKVHLACDWQGLPLATVLTAWQRHETIVFTDLRRAEVRASQARPERLVGRLKERRRPVVRYEKKASHYKAVLFWRSFKST